MNIGHIYDISKHTSLVRKRTLRRIVSKIIVHNQLLQEDTDLMLAQAVNLFWYVEQDCVTNAKQFERLN